MKFFLLLLLFTNYSFASNKKELETFYIDFLVNNCIDNMPSLTIALEKYLSFQELTTINMELCSCATDKLLNHNNPDEIRLLYNTTKNKTNYNFQKKEIQVFSQYLLQCVKESNLGNNSKKYFLKKIGTKTVQRIEFLDREQNLFRNTSV